ncbi:hypothetical protein VEx25_0645 [Vibrio antiquarius]|uniref:Uncharacterized protein n=1 Tax=Vibrio antiquarius (strain Ex25) TaxID=150340 RepID=A0ABM9WVL5_VIBAE|nr:hypothetical protein VEx25_0645 [Vibrio antiquarius]
MAVLTKSLTAMRKQQKPQLSILAQQIYKKSRLKWLIA